MVTAKPFERPLPATPLPWTGERLTTLAGGQVEAEHLHRYFLARALCAGLDVLDIAAGEGYGSALLAQTAASVVGVELDPASVAHAQASYHGGNLRYLQGDARRIPLPNASVDAAVSFETIEHFVEQEDFLAEIRRVLRPGGRFIVSSPERDAYSPPGKTANPFHARELSRAEFVGLLRGQFAHVALLGQRMVTGSALVAEPGSRLPTLVFERRGTNAFEQSDRLRDPVYLVALASEREGFALPDSLYITGDAEVSGAPDATPPAELTGERDRLAAELARAQAALAASERSFRLGQAEFERLTRDNAAIGNELAAMRRSLSWRLTRFLRRGRS